MTRQVLLDAQSEAADAVTDLRAVYAEIFPHRNPEAMKIDETQLAVIVLLRREIRSLGSATANLRPRVLDRISRHNPKDQE